MLFLVQNHHIRDEKISDFFLDFIYLFYFFLKIQTSKYQYFLPNFLVGSKNSKKIGNLMFVFLEISKIIKKI